MERNIKTETIKISGMTCSGCAIKIEKKLRRTAGIKTVRVSYNQSSGQITYDSDLISFKDIIKVIEMLDYKVMNGRDKINPEFDSITGLLSAVVIITALYMVMRHLGILDLLNIFPQAEAGMSYSMLFLIGLLTSVHCMAMCGGISLSQCISAKVAGKPEHKLKHSLRPSILYNTGRVISYTAIGAIVGAIGSVFSFSGAAKGVVQIAAGVFMIIIGLNMLNMFSWLHRFIPRMPAFLTKGLDNNKRSNSPLYVGLLNGLMPCGPLQAMQFYALSTGSPLKGALSMLLFSLGTVPLMFGLGALSSILSQKFTKKVMSAGAVLVVILGFSMFNNGRSLSGLTTPVPVTAGETVKESTNGNDEVQIVNSSVSRRGYEPITVQAGIPVRWTISAEAGTINGCNNSIYIPEYKIEKALTVGDNVIEFTPEKTGTFTYSCWMGMIRSSITVVE